MIRLRRNRKQIRRHERALRTSGHETSWIARERRLRTPVENRKIVGVTETERAKAKKARKRYQRHSKRASELGGKLRSWFRKSGPMVGAGAAVTAGLPQALGVGSEVGQAWTLNKSLKNVFLGSILVRPFQWARESVKARRTRKRLEKARAPLERAYAKGQIVTPANRVDLATATR